MDTMTWPAPTTDLPQTPPAPKKKISSKGWIILALVVAAIIGVAANTAKENAQLKSDMDGIISRSLDNNVTSSGGLDETGYVRDTCAKSLDMDLPGTTQTIRGGLADGTTTVSVIADAFANGYYDNDSGVGSDLTRSEVVSACSSGLRNG